MSFEIVTRLPYDHPYRWDATVFGGPKLWRPSELGAPLALWLDAEDVATITLNGSTVSQWSDKSGTNNHVSQATATLQPVYQSSGFNGKPCLDFDNIDDFLGNASVTNLSNTGDLFFAAVFQMRAGAGAYRPVVGHSNVTLTTAPSGSPVLQRMGTTDAIGVHNTGVAAIFLKVDVTAIDAPRIATYGRSGGTLGNGGAVTVTATGPSQPTYLTEAAQTWNTAPGESIKIGGKQQPTATNPLDGVICEVIACNAKPDDATRQKVEGYLAWKWGLQTSLPIDHLYYSLPPTV